MLFRFDPTVAKEGIADFDRILMVTFFAVLSSSIGVVVAVRLKIATASFADAYALERYKKARDAQGEKLVSGSDDNTMIMW